MSRDVHSCTNWLRPRNPTHPLAFGLVYEGITGQPNRRHLLVTPWVATNSSQSLSSIHFQLIYPEVYGGKKYHTIWIRISLPNFLGSAPACYGSSLGSNPDSSQKYKMGDISKGLANTLKAPENNIQKNFLVKFYCSRKVQVPYFIDWWLLSKRQFFISIK
jgi:hypothetical protein